MSEVQQNTKKKSQVTESLGIVKRNFFSFFWFELLYKAFLFVILIPVLKYFMGLILKINGQTNVTNENLMIFIKNPLSWLLVVLIIFLIAGFVAIEFSGLMNGIHASDEGKKTSVKEMVGKGFAGCKVIFHAKNWMYLLYVIIVLPLTNITESASLTGSFTMPDFIMEVINTTWYYLIPYTLGMVALMYLAVRWIYVLPSLATHVNSFNEAARESGELTQKRIIRTFLILAIWNVAIIVTLILFSFVLIAVTLAVILWLEPTVDVMTVLNPVMMVAFVIVFILFTVITTPTILARIYVGYKTRLATKEKEISPYIPTNYWSTRHPITKWVLVVALTAGIIAFLPARYQEVKMVVTNATAEPLVMAHRGDSVTAPENTLPAFQAAIDNGADAAEMDVQMTKDGTIVVLHDSSIDRTSTGHGNIWEVTYDEIKDLDNGSFFDPKFSDTRIPTLDEVISLCKDRLYLNIEIKRTGHDDGIEKKVLDIIAAHDFEDQCDITSMDYHTLETVRSLSPTIKTVYTTVVAYGSVADLSAADAFSVEGTFVNATFVRYARQMGKEIFVWTVNNEDQMGRMIDLGVDAIITNDPVSCEQLVAETKELGMFGVLSRLLNVFGRIN